jgi:membrane protease YdiL (CAAX protease family)
LGWFILFLVCELAIILFGSNYFDVFPTNKNLTYNLVLSVVSLTVALWLRFHPRWDRYWQIAFAFFMASVAYPLTLLLDERISRFMGGFGLSVDTSRGMAVEKIGEMLLIVIPILVLNLLSGADLGSIFLKRGDLKLGLGIGGLVFVFLSTASFMFAATRFSSMELLGEAVVWGLVFSVANAFMEELWLRGILIKRFMPFIGAGGAVLLTALVFGLLHGFAFYFNATALVFYVLNTLALGLGCGYLMVKSDNIWGALLIHAASDFFLFLAVLAPA